jgi:hypothetical protein
MEKTGEVRINSTPCDECGRPATITVGKRALCDKHASLIKKASKTISLKAFSDPLEFMSD